MSTEIAVVNSITKKQIQCVQIDVFSDIEVSFHIMLR